MDVLSHIMRGVEVRGSIFCHGTLGAPWSLQGGMAGRCLFHVVVEGEACVVSGGQAAQRLRSGDIVMLPRGFSHCVSSGPGVAPTPLGRAVERSEGESFARLVRGGEGCETTLICGTFELEGMDWHPLFLALPEVLVVNANVGAWLLTTLTALDEQIRQEYPGSALIATRLAEVLFVQVLAAWLNGVSRPRGWLGALQDERIGRAIALMHSGPGGDWTAQSLGRAVGMSRSTFYRHFTALVGEPPARYLSRWRMTLAARALRRGSATLSALSAESGYSDVAAFSRAFRAHHGVTPGRYRSEEAAKRS